MKNLTRIQDMVNTSSRQQLNPFTPEMAPDNSSKSQMPCQGQGNANSPPQNNHYHQREVMSPNFAQQDEKNTDDMEFPLNETHHNSIKRRS